MLNIASATIAQTTPAALVIELIRSPLDFFKRRTPSVAPSRHGSETWLSAVTCDDHESAGNGRLIPDSPILEENTMST